MKLYRNILMGVAWTLLGLIGEARAQTCSFDTQGRLTLVRYSTTQTVAYAYDAAGNITNNIQTGTMTEPDSETDGLPDAWELVYFNNLTNTAAGDNNQDTITNLKHYQDGTDPADPDTDDDGVPNVEELVAGTSPTNAASLFQVSSFKLQVSNTVVSWSSTTGRFYSVDLSIDRLYSTWLQFTSDVPGAIGTLSITNSPAPGTPIYRIRVRKP